MTSPGVPRPGHGEPAQRLAEALHAQASTHSSAGVPRPRPPAPGQDPALRRQIAWALAIALLAGLVLGCAIALVSLLFPGVLPTVG
ncbi:hypothetical protein [Pseudonocardia ailaonensis]|uniref:hypothetical protein n=1 Tax=Pseudonocardia ailaonensis TaxID=367279 RepID=UPI0031CED2A1